MRVSKQECKYRNSMKQVGYALKKRKELIVTGRKEEADDYFLKVVAEHFPDSTVTFEDDSAAWIS